ncbi:DUF4817 domain-containing protein [Trichonephila inaurata madagascariensis]|uniref:DUF4817 domain-containing protein n=1 Tax=Trichonephila inaurata madagascariensis TaxID=2747483 RepID=A0A8X6YSG1_9ARAC|nr:DUF4817 domain-containing protein [Trichonephila inaurata madagascariensis]
MKKSDPRFPAFVLFRDEAKFSREGNFDVRNQHVWSDSNPHCTILYHQQKFFVNVWSGISGDNLVTPCILPYRLTSGTYRIFLEQVLPSLLQSVLERSAGFARWSPLTFSHLGS